MHLTRRTETAAQVLARNEAELQTLEAQLQAAQRDLAEEHEAGGKIDTPLHRERLEHLQFEIQRHAAYIALLRQEAAPAAVTSAVDADPDQHASPDSSADTAGIVINILAASKNTSRVELVDAPAATPDLPTVTELDIVVESAPEEEPQVRSPARVESLTSGSLRNRPRATSSSQRAAQPPTPPTRTSPMTRLIKMPSIPRHGADYMSNRSSVSSTPGAPVQGWAPETPPHPARVQAHTSYHRAIEHVHVVQDPPLYKMDFSFVGGDEVSWV